MFRVNAANYTCPACHAKVSSDVARAAGYRCLRCRQAYLVMRSGAQSGLGTVIPPRALPVGNAVEVSPTPPLGVSGVPSDTDPPARSATSVDGDSDLGQSESAMVAVAILPPALNRIDVTAMEQLAGTFDKLPSPVALEIAGQATERRLVVRGERRSVQRVVHQLYHVYRQVDARSISTTDDPARSLVQPGGMTGVTSLRPAGPAFVSLRTWLEFEGNDPLNPVFGAYSGLQPDEVLLSQVIIHGAAAEHWASPYLRELNALKRRGFGGEGPLGPLPDLFAGTIGAVLVLIGLWAFLFTYWGSFGGHWYVTASVGAALFGFGIWLLMLKRNDWAVTLDAEAEAKLKEQAFQVELRLYARAATAERTQALLDRLAATYRLFNTTSGNRLKTFRLRQYVAPDDFSTLDRKSVALLSVKEIAGLWHMPVGEAPELVEWAMYQRLVPLPKDVTFPGGVAVGMSRRWAQAVPVQLSPEAMNRNILIAGKSQFGKTTLMEHLAAHWMQDRERAVLIVDPHGDLARRVMGLVPADRAGDVIAIDLSDPTRSVGLNLLDVSGGASPDELSEAFVDVGKSLWEANWGPRMLIPLVNGLKALAYANLSRPADRQYTIFSLATLLNCEDEAREAFLNSEVPARERPDLFRYFFGEYRNATASMREQIISPVLSKAHAFERSATIRRLVGQPRSTLNLYEAIRQHKIIILNTNAGVLRDDLADFLGSFFLNVLRQVIMSQAQLPRSERVRVSAVVDEIQKLKGVDHAALVGELQKYGGNFAFGTQALGNLRQLENGEDFLGGILAGVTTLVAFQLNGEDAVYLTERDFDSDQLRPQSLIHLPIHTAYVRTVTPDGRVPAIFSLEITPPLIPDEQVSQRVLALASAYTVPADEADRLANFSFQVFEEEWALGSNGAASASAEAATAGDSDAQSATTTADGVPPDVQEAATSPSPRRAARPPGWENRQMPPAQPIAGVAGTLNVKQDPP